MGIEIAGYQYKREGYFLIDREFELSEIRLLCDAIAASDMIKESSSKIIIKKLLIIVKINTIPSVIHSWVMTHINQCEIIGPKSFRDKIQNEIMDAYRKYCM